MDIYEFVDRIQDARFMAELEATVYSGITDGDSKAFARGYLISSVDDLIKEYKR